MPSLKEFRLRIVSVKSTQKITKALQMVATATSGSLSVINGW